MRIVVDWNTWWLESKIIVGVCYKCPLVSEQELKEMFKAIKHAAESRCLILGDFNYPNIDWDSWECNKDSEEFVDLIQDIFFVSACQRSYQRE